MSIIHRTRVSKDKDILRIRIPHPRKKIKKIPPTKFKNPPKKIYKKIPAKNLKTDKKIHPKIINKKHPKKFNKNNHNNLKKSKKIPPKKFPLKSFKSSKKYNYIHFSQKTILNLTGSYSPGATKDNRNLSHVSGILLRALRKIIFMKYWSAIWRPT